MEACVLPPLCHPHAVSHAMTVTVLIVSRVSWRARLTANTSCSQFDEQCLNPLRVESTEMPRGLMGMKSLPYFSVNNLHEIGWYHHSTMRVRDMRPHASAFPASSWAWGIRGGRGRIYSHRIPNIAKPGTSAPLCPYNLKLVFLYGAPSCS